MLRALVYFPLSGAGPANARELDGDEGEELHVDERT
jgi:hypothetical protein